MFCTDGSNGINTGAIFGIISYPAFTISELTGLEYYSNLTTATGDFYQVEFINSTNIIGAAI